MKDETKEILDKLREQYNTDSKLGKEIANEFGNYQLNYKELTLLLDYITNLQEQLEEYQKALDETTSEKIALLSNYIDSNIIEESDILYEQLHIMLDYRSILKTRINEIIDYLKSKGDE